MLPPFVQPIVNKVVKEVDKAVNGFNKEPGRKLTAGEIKLASGVYGSLINYDKVRVFNAKWHVHMPDGRAHSPNGNVYYDSKAGYKEDFSLGNITDRSTFIHELAHVWQVQRGENIIVNIPIQHGSNNASYKYAYIFGDVWKSFANKGYKTLVPKKGYVHVYYLLKFEAQAEFVSDYYRLKNGSTAELGANKGHGRAEYERLMPPELRARAVPTS